MDATKTWILVADGAQARLFCHDGPGKPVRALDHDDFEGQAVKAREVDRDKPGRTFTNNTMDEGRSAYEPKSNPQDRARHELMREVVEDLNRHAQRNEFDQLIVCAPAQTMASIRELMPKPLRQKVVAEETKNYTGSGEADLERHLTHLLPVDPDARRYQDMRRPGTPPDPDAPGGSRH